jgi:short-subunit dehydrogenase
MRIEGRTVLLSGATGGIGRALARGFRNAGAELILTARREDTLADLAAEVAGTAIVADLSRPDDVARMLAEAGPIDILVANAAIAAAGRICDVAQTDIDDAIAVNLQAPLQMAHAVVPAMKQNGRGHLVFMGSAGSRVTAAQSPLYNATKFGLRGFALALRQDLHGTGVGVSIVEPMFVRDVGMFADSGLAVPKGMRTSAADEVVRVVLRAIRRNRAEELVGRPDLRAAIAASAMAPESTARAARLFGGQFQPEGGG